MALNLASYPGFKQSSLTKFSIINKKIPAKFGSSFEKLKSLDLE